MILLSDHHLSVQRRARRDRARPGDHDGAVQGATPVAGRAALARPHLEQVRYREEGDLHLR